MTRTRLDQELEALNTSLTQMGEAVLQSLSQSLAGLTQPNDSQARSVIAGDRQIDKMESDLETDCLRLLWHEQPLARDLRAITAVMKIITDLERIGDQAADIADLSLRRHSLAVGVLSPELIPMAKAAAFMVKRSLTAFARQDVTLAQQVMEMDDGVDRQFEQVKAQLLATVAKEPAHADSVIDAFMIAKYLERIGDHAVNICEWVVFDQTGVRENTDTARRHYGSSDLLC